MSSLNPILINPSIVTSHLGEVGAQVERVVNSADTGILLAVLLALLIYRVVAPGIDLLNPLLYLVSALRMISDRAGSRRRTRAGADAISAPAISPKKP